MVNKLNSDPEVHGILVQLPLPPGVDQDEVIAAIEVSKDVDGFHPNRIGVPGETGIHQLRIRSHPAFNRRLCPSPRPRLCWWEIL